MGRVSHPVADRLGPTIVLMYARLSKGAQAAAARWHGRSRPSGRRSCRPSCGGPCPWPRSASPCRRTAARAASRRSPAPQAAVTPGQPRQYRLLEMRRVFSIRASTGQTAVPPRSAWWPPRPGRAAQCRPWWRSFLDVPTGRYRHPKRDDSKASPEMVRKPQKRKHKRKRGCRRHLACSPHTEHTSRAACRGTRQSRPGRPPAARCAADAPAMTSNVSHDVTATTRLGLGL